MEARGQIESVLLSFGGQGRPSPSGASAPLRVTLALALLVTGCSTVTGPPKFAITPQGMVPICRYDKDLGVLYPLPCFVWTDDGPLFILPKPGLPEQQGPLYNHE